MGIRKSTGGITRLAQSRSAAFGLLFVSSLCFWLSLFGSQAILPLFLSNRGFDTGVIGWVMGCGTLTALPARLYSGHAIDRRGPTAFLVIGCLLVGLPIALQGFRPALPGLITLSLVQGAGIAMVMNAALALVAELAPVHKRGAALGWWGLTNNAGNALGATLAAWLAGRWGYPTAFFAMGAAGLAAAVWGLLLPQFERTVPVEQKGPWFARSAMGPGLVGGSLGFAGGVFMLLAPMRAGALGYANIGYYMTAYAGAMVIARLVAGHLSDRFGRSWVIMPGLGLVAAAMVAMGLISQPLPALAAPFLLGLGLGTSMPGLLAWTIDRAATAERATAVSTFYLVYDCAFFLGSVLVGKALQQLPAAAYGGVAGVTLLALLLYVAMSRSGKRKDKPITEVV